jgi:hypothetical protein
VSAGWLWEMRSAIVARVRNRNPMEVADELGYRFLRLLPYGRHNRKLIGLVNSSAFTRIYTVVPAQNILNERVALKATMESEKWSRWLRCS